MKPATFRFLPAAYWTMIVGPTLLIALRLWGFVDPSSSSAAPIDPVQILLFGLLTGCAVFGIYCRSLEITVDLDGLRVASLFGERKTRFDGIGQVLDRETGRWRTLEVKARTGKRLLRVTSSFLPGYPELVDLLDDGTRSNSETGVK